MTTPITTFPITGFTILDLALVSPAAGQFLEVGGSSDGRVDIDALATYCRAGLAWSDLGAKPTTLAGYGITDAQPLDADLTALAGLATTGLVQRTGAGTFSTTTIDTSTFATAAQGALADTALQPADVGSIATQAANSVAITGGSISGITDLAIADGGTGASTAAAARTNLGLAIGTDIQAYDADLAAFAALATTGLVERTGAGVVATRTIGTASGNIPVVGAGNKLAEVIIPGGGAIRAWAVFDAATTTPTILASANILSVTKTQSGVWAITTSIAAPSNNYVVQLSARPMIAWADAHDGVVGITGTNSFVIAHFENGAFTDSEYVSVVVIW